MKRIIEYCTSCDEGFAERFGFCPNCGTKLETFEMAPPVSVSTIQGFGVQSEETNRVSKLWGLSDGSKGIIPPDLKRDRVPDLVQASNQDSIVHEDIMATEELNQAEGQSKSFRTFRGTAKA